MTGMQRLMKELRRHAAGYERATDPEERRRALRRFRIAFLLGSQSLGVTKSAGDDPDQSPWCGTVLLRTGEVAARGEPEDVTGSRTESDGWSRTTGLADTRTDPDSGSSHSVGTSVSVGSCPDCGRRAGEVEWRSTTRTIGVARSHGESITGSRSVSTTPPEQQTRGENERSADEHDRDDAAE